MPARCCSRTCGGGGPRCTATTSALPASDGREPAPGWSWGRCGASGFAADTYMPGVQAWVDHGFAVALVNYRGSAGYGKQWRDAIQGGVGFLELDDLAAVHDQLTADGVADPGRSVLMGGSY